MRVPDFFQDGWCLEEGEELHREAPDTFHIPDLELRRILQPGDYAKLVFRISAEGDEEVERMWVIVRERMAGGYLGMLANEPYSITENDQFWWGTELPFEYRHIIAVQHASKESVLLSEKPAPIPWR